MIAASISILIVVLAPVEKNSEGDGAAIDSVPFAEPVAHGVVEFLPAVAVGVYCNVLVAVIRGVQSNEGVEVEVDASAEAHVADEVLLTAPKFAKAEDTRTVEMGNNNDGAASDEAADGTGV